MFNNTIYAPAHILHITWHGKILMLCCVGNLITDTEFFLICTKKKN